MGMAITSMFIIVTEAMAWWRGPPVTRYDGILVGKEFRESMEGMECSICLTEFTKERQYLAIKRCNHIFHEDCLKSWLKYSKICPLDRANIMP